MDNSKAVAQLKSALNTLFGDWPVRIIIARDDDVKVVVVENGVRVWKNADRTDFFSGLSENQELWLSIIGWPVNNSKGEVMVPVRWQGQVGYINYKYVREKKQ